VLCLVFFHTASSQVRGLVLFFNLGSSEVSACKGGANDLDLVACLKDQRHSSGCLGSIVTVLRVAVA
jgi:hypothetical protein